MNFYELKYYKILIIVGINYKKQFHSYNNEEIRIH